MDRPTPQQLKQAAQALYGDHAQPIINAIDRRERYRSMQKRIRELKKRYPYKVCVSKIRKEFNASESSVKKVDIMEFPGGS